MQKVAGEEIPETDREVNATGDQMRDFVSLLLLMRIEKGVDSSRMTIKYLIVWPIFVGEMLPEQ